VIINASVQPRKKTQKKRNHTETKQRKIKEHAIETVI
jgi:hypothetical protein